MGKGYNNYMTKKFFHPGSKENIKRVWMAEQKAEHDKKKQEDLLNQYQREQEMYENRALLGDEKAKMGLSFMYDAPPGAKQEREKEDGEPEFKFEWQRKFNAPRESYAKGNEEIRDQPFGIEVRNVRCIKCHTWGHMNTDRICPLFGKDITAEPPAPKAGPSIMDGGMLEDGLMLKGSILARKLDPRNPAERLVSSGEEDDPEVQFLKSLSTKQKKKLLKKLSRMQEKGGKVSPGKKSPSKKKRKKKHRPKESDDSDSETEGKQRKKRKEKKAKKKKVKKESSSSESSSGSDDNQGRPAAGFSRPPGDRSRQQRESREHSPHPRGRQQQERTERGGPPRDSKRARTNRSRSGSPVVSRHRSRSPQDHKEMSPPRKLKDRMISHGSSSRDKIHRDRSDSPRKYRRRSSSDDRQSTQKGYHGRDNSQHRERQVSRQNGKPRNHSKSPRNYRDRSRSRSPRRRGERSKSRSPRRQRSGSRSPRRDWGRSPPRQYDSSERRRRIGRSHLDSSD